MKYRREIDGLRAVAVIPVILFHAGSNLFSGGFVGVDIFFVLSGYLITSIIIAEKQAGTFSLINFYERRARRILPALFFVLAVCLPFAWFWMLPGELKDFAQSLTNVSVYISNYYFMKDTGYFAAASDQKPLLHTWSLAIEEQYYLVFPALVIFFWQYGKRWVISVLAVIALASFAYAQWKIDIDPEKLFFDTRGRVWELLTGSCIALYNSSRFYRDFPLAVRQFFSMLGIGLIFYAIFAYDEQILFPSVYTIIPVLGTALVIEFATPKTIIGRILCLGVFVGIGLISYSTYLWHQPLLAFARLKSEKELSSTLVTLISLSSLILAYFSWRFVEAPFRDKTKTSRRTIALSATALSAFMITVGLLSTANDGFDSRFKYGNVSIAQVLEDLQKERAEFTGRGKCHYSPKGVYKELDDFLKDWQCYEDPIHPNLSKVPYIVVGDSHASDIVMALKTNGYVPVHMTGSDCSLSPKFMLKHCKKQFAYIKDFASKHPEYSHIILANRIKAKEVTPEALDEMVKYWSLPGKELVFLTARPEFFEYKRGLMLKRSIEISFANATVSESPSVVDYLRARNVRVINTRDIFCSMTINCGWADDSGALLSTDGNHLSRRGAELFGRGLVEKIELRNSILSKVLKEDSPSLIGLN
ncbi:MAG: acyltransferase [Deltaproteobacteria bacterium]|nr:acyltransferase [Deltaproteobacteria bacterium]